MQRQIEEHAPAWSAPVLLAGAWFGVHMRLATESALGPIQRTFRIRQNWRLYGGGPRVILRLEVRVDDELRYRSADPAHQWATDQLDHRRFRPIVERVVEKAGAGNFGVVCALVRRRAEADGGAPRVIEMTATRQARDGSAPRVGHGARCAAPDWRVVHLDADGHEVVE